MNSVTRIQVGQSKLKYRKVGSGPDLVFVHGWPLHSETWRNVAKHLDGFTCHLIDLPGSGESLTPATVPVSLDGHVDAIVEAVKVLGLEEAVLVGNDSGGMVARFAMERLGDTVVGLVLTGSEVPGHHPALINRLQMAMKLPGALAITKLFMNSPRIARSNQMLGGCFWNTDLIEGDFRQSVLDQTFTDDQVLARQLEVLASYTAEAVDDLEAVHQKITCPTLLIWGEADPFFPVAKAKAMCSQFGGETTFEVVQNAKLLVHEEHPERFAELTSKFVSTLSDRAHA